MSRGTVGVRHKAGAITYAVSVDRIRHKAISRITHSQRPESIVGRKAARREMYHVVVPAVESVARGIFARRPIHGLLRYVYWARKYLRARGPGQHVVAGHTASENGDPAVDLRGLNPCENLGREETQHNAYDKSLDDVCADGTMGLMSKH